LWLIWGLLAHRTLKRERSLRLKGAVPQPVDAEARNHAVKTEMVRLHKILEPRHINRDGIKVPAMTSCHHFSLLDRRVPLALAGRITHRLSLMSPADRTWANAVDADWCLQSDGAI